ncbi:hypothetical protein Nepgr_016454 [Nepenthes gracilis]|uniref:Uncharacterized protein n=1 Tax=Nepenthes gracilis TaxID=150966 RepID=A0AAD3SMQ9_NEPGR|nr:hypothetical protein Nepgr_016454 [Nepenthes gracilis]
MTHNKGVLQEDTHGHQTKNESLQHISDKREIEIESPKAQKTPCSGQPTEYNIQVFSSTSFVPWLENQHSSRSICSERKETWQPAPTQRHTVASIKHIQATVRKNSTNLLPKAPKAPCSKEPAHAAFIRQQQQGSKGKHSKSSSIFQEWLIHIGQWNLPQQQSFNLTDPQLMLTDRHSISTTAHILKRNTCTSRKPAKLHPPIAALLNTAARNLSSHK